MGFVKKKFPSLIIDEGTVRPALVGSLFETKFSHDRKELVPRKIRRYRQQAGQQFAMFRHGIMEPTKV